MVVSGWVSESLMGPNLRQHYQPHRLPFSAVAGVESGGQSAPNPPSGPEEMSPSPLLPTLSPPSHLVSTLRANLLIACESFLLRPAPSSAVDFRLNIRQEVSDGGGDSKQMWEQTAQQHRSSTSTSLPRDPSRCMSQRWNIEIRLLPFLFPHFHPCTTAAAIPFSHERQEVQSSHYFHTTFPLTKFIRLCVLYAQLTLTASIPLS